MMDPSNLDHHHQEELHGGINDADFSTGVLSRDFRLSNEISSPTPTTHMIQNLGFHWGTGNADQSYMNHQATLPSTSCIKHEQMDHEASFLKILTSGCDQANDLQPFAGDLFYGAPRGNYSMVLPTADISRMNPPLSSSPYQVSLGLDLQALDLLASARFGRSFCELPSFDSMGLLREESSTPPFEFGHLQEQDQEPPNSHYKISPSLSGVTESIKRGNNILEHKESQGAPKKSRFDTRSSSSPFKVRKEKLGDRIAALQQLVAPFGKTDTASVLMEAIGYIKFLQDQVETLSVPYMKSSNNIKLRTSQGVYEASSEATDEPNPDLRSRGLCLVPLSYTSYVTNENEGVWSAPNYRGID